MADEYTVRQAAEYLRVSDETVRRYIRSDRLKATRRGTQWFVARDDLLAFSDSDAEGTVVKPAIRREGLRVQAFGMVLVAASAAVLLGYGAYEFFRLLFDEGEGVPLAVSVSIVVFTCGLLVMLIGVGIERWVARRNTELIRENFDEVEP